MGIEPHRRSDMAYGLCRSTGHDQSPSLGDMAASIIRIKRDSSFGFFDGFFELMPIKCH